MVRCIFEDLLPQGEHVDVLEKVCKQVAVTPYVGTHTYFRCIKHKADDRYPLMHTREP